MAVGIDVPAGMTDWVSYLTTTWFSDYDYRGNGFFNSSSPYSQWAAGDLTNSAESGVILNGSFTYGPPGGFSGTLSSLEFGADLSGSASAGYDLDTVLTLDLSGATATTAFTYAIYYLSTQGNFSYLWTYLGQQGTEQVGNSSANILYSFAGDDELTGGSGVDTFYYVASYNSGGWGDDVITDFADGSEYIVFSGYGWSSYTDFTDAGGSIVGNTISYAGNTIEVNFEGNSGSLTSADLFFV